MFIAVDWICNVARSRLYSPMIFLCLWQI